MLLDSDYLKKEFITITLAPPTHKAPGSSVCPAVFIPLLHAGARGQGRAGRDVPWASPAVRAAVCPSCHPSQQRTPGGMGRSAPQPVWATQLRPELGVCFQVSIPLASTTRSSECVASKDPTSSEIVKYSSSALERRRDACL